MSRLSFWLMHISNALVAGTGLVYGWMRYGAAPADAFAVVNHPWQPAVQHLHILFAPLLVLLLGIFWQGHAWSHWVNGAREGRRSGMSALILALPMILSGYLLQIATSEAWRCAWAWVHAATSLLWLAGYLVHTGAHVSAKRRAREKVA